MLFTALVAAIGLSTLTYGQKLTKPPLENDLGALQKGLLDTLKPAGHVSNQWNGWIPLDCQNMAIDNKFNPDDVTAYAVTYDDV